MSFAIAGVAILVLIFMGVSVPISFLGGAFLLTAITGGSTGVFATNAFYILNSISMLAIPLFVVGGNLIERSGIAEVLVDLASKALRNVKGGMAATIPVVSCFFGALCGSALATATTLCTAMAPRLEKLGYDKAYVAALIAASSPFGYMIPPNVNAIIFASVSTASVGALFLATIIPAIFWAAAYLVINRIIYTKYYTPPKEQVLSADATASVQNLQESPAKQGRVLSGLVMDVIPAFIMPVIILGGIYSGIFTPTEAGAISCLYAAIIGSLVYKKFRIKDIASIFKQGAYDVSSIIIIFPMTLIFSRILTVNRVPDAIAKFMLGITTNRIILILIINLLLFLVGFFLDGSIIILSLVPLLTPVATAVGISTIQLGVIVFVAIGIGAVTPPMATCLLSCSRISNVPLKDMIRPLAPYVLFGGLPTMLLVSFVPWVSEWLPHVVLGA